MKRLLLVLLIVSTVCALYGCEKPNVGAEKKESREQEQIKDMETKEETNKNSKIQSNERETDSVLRKIQNWYTGEIWNNFVDFDAYRETGKDCTGSDIDIEFVYNNFIESYKHKDEYDSYINSLTEEYGGLKKIWGKMNEQIELIYQDLEANGVTQGREGLELDLLRQYSEKFYELISEYCNKGKPNENMSLGKLENATKNIGEDKSEGDIDDLEKYLSDFCTGKRVQMAAEMVGAEKGFKYSDESTKFEVYQYDINSEQYKNAKEQGKIYLKDFNTYVDVAAVNGRFVLITDGNDELIKKFESYPQ